MPTYFDLITRLSPTVLRGRYGRRLGGALALLFNSAAQGLVHALKAPWIRSDDGPAYDALALLGSEMSLPRYPVESWGQYKARLDRAWDDWPFAGAESSLIGQLAAAGYPGAQILFFPSAPGPHGEAEYWSQFWLYFPPGTHPVTGPGPAWDSFDWGDGTLYGPAGLTLEYVETLFAIIKKWKPGHWICRGIIFGLTGAAIWGQFDWGDANYGGAVELGMGGPELYPA